jgi:hypothetical protein
MPQLPFLYELSPLYLLQAALTIWMLVDANRRGVEFYWYWIILAFQPLGAWGYFFLYKLPDLRGNVGSGWLSNLFHRPPPLDELRYRAERSPTMANHLELGQRLTEKNEYAEAIPHLEAALASEPEHCQALFCLAQCQRGQGHPEQALPQLQKLIAKQSGWRDYEAWRALVDVREETNDAAGALTTSRELVRLSPTLRHKCLLAEHLMANGGQAEARQILEQGLQDHAYQPGPIRRRNTPWARQAKQLLKKIG